MVDRIVQRISLEGAEDVQAKLKKTGEVGAKALESTQKTISDSNSGLAKYGDVFAGLNGKTEESREQIEGIKKVLETIKPAAEKAGLEIGNIGEFGKIGRGGVIALAAAIGGTLVAAIERAGDAARDQAQRLGSFAGSAQKGIESYNALKKTAAALEVPSSGLAEPFEQLLRANQRSGSGIGGQGLQDILRTLVEGATADRVPLDKSQQGITTFVSSLREQGQLTPEIAKATQDLFPTLMKRLVEDLQKSFPGQVNPFTTQQVLGSLRTIGPQIGADLATSRANFHPGIEDSLNKLKSSGEKLGNALDNTTIIASTIDKAASLLDTVAEGIKKWGPSIGKIAANAVDGSTLSLAAKLFGIGSSAVISGASKAKDVVGDAVNGATETLTARQPSERIEDGFADLSDPSRRIGDAFEALEPKVKSAEEAFDEFNKRGAEQLGVIASKLTAEQARIDYEHKPEETDLQIGRDKLAVDTAAIARQSAQIGVQEAAKGKELANLAPEQAESASRNAESRYSKALKNLRELQGYDTRAIQQPTAIQDALNELKDADTARKVADINRRYAYLEPEKAELGQKKAETDIRSAGYLQQDASLKLAKDSQGRQLSTDVAGLRYAQAQLDEQKQIAKTGDVSVSLLDKILATLQKRGSTSSKESEGREPGERSGRSGADGRPRFGDLGAAAGSTPAAASGRDLFGRDGVVNIPPGASQDEINKALAKQRSATEAPSEQPNLASKEAFRADQDQSIEDLKADWKSQRELNAQLHNGSFESRTVGTQASPQARTPAGVSQVYPPPVRGHYDDNFQFVPDVPTYKALGAGASIPATNNYDFAGRKNPAGPYQEGISAPLTFPQYSRDRLQNLPSEYPNGVPLPQPRPPEADQQQQGALPDANQLSGLSTAFAGFIQSVVEDLDKGNAQAASADTETQQVQTADAGQTSSSDAASDIDQSTSQVDDSLKGLSSAVDDAASSIRSGATEAGTQPTYAAGGGLISGPGSTKSDSIPAMLSNKEFVVNADSAQKHIGLLHAINDGKDILHYAIGGPVGVIGDVGMPRVKAIPVSSTSGGGDSQQHHGSLDLGIDGRQYRVYGPDETLKAMSRAAVSRSVAQTGKRPSWHQGA